MIEYVGGIKTKLPSDSSASNIDQSLFPSFAELFIEFMTPPLIIVGSIFVSWNIDAIKDVVVVLPCDPTTTIFFVKDGTDGAPGSAAGNNVFVVTLPTSTAYGINGAGFSSVVQLPYLYLHRGLTYEFQITAAGHPFVVFGITFEDLTKITNGKVVSIVE